LLTFLSARQLTRRGIVSVDSHHSLKSGENCCINTTAHPLPNRGKPLKRKEKGRKAPLLAPSGPAKLVRSADFT
jgi:hypothetical protein